MVDMKKLLKKYLEENNQLKKENMQLKEKM